MQSWVWLLMHFLHQEMAYAVWLTETILHTVIVQCLLDKWSDTIPTFHKLDERVDSRIHYFYSKVSGDFQVVGDS